MLDFLKFNCQYMSCLFHARSVAPFATLSVRSFRRRLEHQPQKGEEEFGKKPATPQGLRACAWCGSLLRERTTLSVRGVRRVRSDVWELSTAACHRGSRQASS